MSTSDTIASPEEAQALVNATQDDTGPQPQQGSVLGKVQPVPVDIILTDITVFKCPKIGSWLYTPYGIFATGHWAHTTVDTEEDNLFPYNSIRRVKFDFPAYEKFLEERSSD